MLKPGNVAPEFVLPDENGDEVSLTQLLQPEVSKPAQSDAQAKFPLPKPWDWHVSPPRRCNLRGKLHPHC